MMEQMERQSKANQQMWVVADMAGTTSATIVGTTDSTWMISPAKIPVPPWNLKSDDATTPTNKKLLLLKRRSK